MSRLKRAFGFHRFEPTNHCRRLFDFRRFDRIGHELRRSALRQQKIVLSESSYPPSYEPINYLRTEVDEPRSRLFRDARPTGGALKLFPREPAILRQLRPKMINRILDNGALLQPAQERRILIRPLCHLCRRECPNFASWAIALSSPIRKMDEGPPPPCSGARLSFFQTATIARQVLLFATYASFRTRAMPRRAASA